MSKRWLNVFFIIFSLSVLFALFVFKNSIYEFVPKNQIKNYNIQYQDSISAFIKKTFNYIQNKQTYSFTFLEFGSTGCRECKQMEKVLDEVKLKYKNKVNVIFYNVTKAENMKIKEHFDITMIPVQVLLDKSGKEYFRHLGYYSFEELSKEFNLD
ncbi:MAG: hypothetical protein A2033_00110 [Bacteroidetes bacterium GWA2_31_9]|nr:MAG: hypothetical protein A2033_00110 [Bacteroidetes bacterium GWA2_31_9]